MYMDMERWSIGVVGVWLFMEYMVIHGVDGGDIVDCTGVLEIMLGRMIML